MTNQLRAELHERRYVMRGMNRNSTSDGSVVKKGPFVPLASAAPALKRRAGITALTKPQWVTTPLIRNHCVFFD